MPSLTREEADRLLDERFGVHPATAGLLRRLRFSERRERLRAAAELVEVLQFESWTAPLRQRDEHPGGEATHVRRSHRTSSQRMTQE